MNKYDLDIHLINSSREGKLEDVEMCLKRGADANSHSGSPLRSAAYYGHKQVCRLLLKYGASFETAIIPGSFSIDCIEKIVRMKAEIEHDIAMEDL